VYFRRYGRPLRELEPLAVPLLNDSVVPGDGGVVSDASFICPITSDALSLAVSVMSVAVSDLSLAVSDLSLAVSTSDDAADRAVSAMDRASSVMALPVEPYSFHRRWRRRESSALTAPSAAPTITSPPIIRGHRLAIVVSCFLPVARRAIVPARRAPSRAMSIDLSTVGSIMRCRTVSSRGAIIPAAEPAAWAAAVRR
jgi:hypothetical protein